MYICLECNHVFEEGEERIARDYQGECHGSPECGKKIVGVKSKSGKIVTAEELYQSCGMCYHCYQDKKAAETA